MCFFFPEQWLNQMPFLATAGVSVEDVEHLSPMLSMFMLSSGAGKLTAILHGDAAIRTFCRLNLAATGCLVVLSTKYYDIQGMVTWSTFFGLYAYYGFFS